MSQPRAKRRPPLRPRDHSSVLRNFVSAGKEKIARISRSYTEAASEYEVEYPGRSYFASAMTAITAIGMGVSLIAIAPNLPERVVGAGWTALGIKLMRNHVQDLRQG